MIEMIKRLLGLSKRTRDIDPAAVEARVEDARQREELRLLELQMDVLREDRKSISGPLPMLDWHERQRYEH